MIFSPLPDIVEDFKDMFGGQQFKRYRVRPATEQTDNIVLQISQVFLLPHNI